ncbi:MAG: hypothetical protein OXQ29_28240 [Rhodospirillaceae bacterium]|nr:hypothetical protein [Rhodospirillaceae bacterium]
MARKTLDQLIEDAEGQFAAARKKLDGLRERRRAVVRKQDTRRKIIAGGMLLAAAGSDDGPREGETLDDWMARRLAATLKRPDERSLFGLEPLVPPAEAPRQEAAENGEPDADALTPGVAGISVEDGRILVGTPARSAGFAAGFRSMGGEWDKRRQLWTGIPEGRLDDVAELARSCFEDVRMPEPAGAMSTCTPGLQTE